MTTPARDASCPCGSGNRFDQCHGRAASAFSTTTTSRIEEATTLFTDGLVAHQEGDLLRADSLYEALLLIAPHHAEALYLRGVISLQQDHFDEAISYISQAIAHNPSVPEFYTHLGAALHGRGDIAAAITSYEQALQLNPRSASAHFNVANALSANKDFSGAIEHYRASIQEDKSSAATHFNLGNTFRAHSDLNAAIAAYSETLRLQPTFPLAAMNLGVALQESGQLSAAITCYQEELRSSPENPEALCNLATALQDQGELSQAARYVARAIQHTPRMPHAHRVMAGIMRDQGRINESITHLNEALSIDPSSADTHYAAGLTYQQTGDLHKAVAHYQTAVDLNPEHAEAQSALLHMKNHICDWTKIEELADLVKNRVLAKGIASPFSSLGLFDSPTEQRAVAERWAERHYAPLAPLRDALTHPPTPTPPPLRVGYLSADFHDHATAHLIASLFALHDRSRVHVSAYSLGPDDHSPIRARLQASVDAFVDLAPLSTPAAANRIAADALHLLVDLKGYTQGARTAILALRPAPLQLSYLGYPGTMGASFIDYLITDRILTPPSHQPFFSERLAFLPHSYQCNDRLRPIADRTPTRSECALPDDAFVFCSFNNSYKITPTLFARWMRLLHQTPGSVLWLLDANPWAATNLRAHAHTHDIDPARLIFAPRAPLPDHLARHRLADLFLDTTPVGAHTTASDALWAGLPVLTYAGETFASRVAASLLHAIGLPELVTTSLDDYEALALHLAHTPATLQALRTKLAANRDTTPLFDALRFTRDLEDLYESLWETYGTGADESRLARGAHV